MSRSCIDQIHLDDGIQIAGRLAMVFTDDKYSAGEEAQTEPDTCVLTRLQVDKLLYAAYPRIAALAVTRVLCNQKQLD